MNKIVYKIGSGIATAAMLALSAAPSAFASSITISGNGSFSDNDVSVRNNQSTTITQTNRTDITNSVNTSQNTGGNRASFNTGGDVSIHTGDASSNVHITNIAGANIARVDRCGCDRDFDIRISGNGSFSDNRVDLRNRDSFTLRQLNDSDITNRVNTRQNTGNNTASFNTGSWWWKDRDGDVSIRTGDARSRTDIFNKAGLNVLH